MWIQTGVTVRKRLSWVLTSVTLTSDLWPWPFAWTSLLSLVITPENFMMIRWWEHGEKGVTDRRTDRRTDGLNQSYRCLVAAKNTEMLVLGIDTKIEVIVVSPTTWEAHHSPRTKRKGYGELPRSLVTPQWPKLRYQFLSYHDASKHIKFMQIRVCISRKLLKHCSKSATMESMATDHCHSSLLSYILVTIVMSQLWLCY